MEIKREATAGTLESSDIMVTVMPWAEGVSIHLTSSVEEYYGDSIRAIIAQMLERLDARNVRVEAVDHGALDCTIRARLTTALRRASEEAAQ